jgi:hypothetical protein
MTHDTQVTDLQQELDILLRRAGLVVPEDRMDAILAGYADLKRLTALLRQPRTAAAEPSNIYSLVPLTKEA